MLSDHLSHVVESHFLASIFCPSSLYIHLFCLYAHVSECVCVCVTVLLFCQKNSLANHFLTCSGLSFPLHTILIIHLVAAGLCLELFCWCQVDYCGAKGCDHSFGQFWLIYWLFLCVSA